MGKKKHFWSFIFILIAKIKIVSTSFNCHNNIHRKFDAYITIFYQKYTTKICLINLKFLKFLWWTFSNSSWFFLCVWTCIYEFYSIKPSHFTGTKIYVKLDSKVAKTLQSYHLKTGAIYWKWNYLSSETIDKSLIREWKIMVKTKTEKLHLILMSLLTSLLI